MELIDLRQSTLLFITKCEYTQETLLFFSPSLPNIFFMKLTFAAIYEN